MVGHIAMLVLIVVIVSIGVLLMGGWLFMVLIGGPAWLVHRMTSMHRMYKVGQRQCDRDGYPRQWGGNGLWNYGPDRQSPIWTLPWPYDSLADRGFVSGEDRVCVRRLPTGEVIYCDRRGQRLKKPPRELRDVAPAEILDAIERAGAHA